MKILQLIPSLSVGGAERLVSLLALALDRRGHDVSVVALGPAVGSWIEAELRAAGLSLYFLDKGLGLDPRVVPRLTRVLRQVRPDVVHTHLHSLKYLVPAGALGGRPPVVHTLHNLAQHEAVRADRLLQRLVFGHGVEPVAIGQAVADSAERVYGHRPRHVIPNGIPVADFQPVAGQREALRAELGLRRHSTALLVVGRLNPQKNHAHLLTALSDADISAHLLVVGEGELRARLEHQAAVLGLSARVHFLGVRRDVPALLGAADIFVLPSDYEGNPLVVMEAMAAGLPVVATAVGCVPELVSARTGRLVPPRDTAALAAALQELTEDPGLAISLGDQGRRVALQRFDAGVMAAAYEGVYEGVCESNR